MSWKNILKKENWGWEDAFAKHGFDGGEAGEHVNTVEDYIKSKGYLVDVFYRHRLNDNITGISLDESDIKKPEDFKTDGFDEDENVHIRREKKKVLGSSQKKYKIIYSAGKGDVRIQLKENDPVLLRLLDREFKDGFGEIDDGNQKTMLPV